MATNETDLRTNESDQWSSQSSGPVQTFDVRPSTTRRTVVRAGTILSVAWVRTPKGGVVRIVGRGIELAGVQNRPEKIPEK